MLFIKFILILLLGFIVASLFSGLYYLVKDKGQTRRTVNALSVRIGLSIVAILVVVAAAALGIIDFNANPLNSGASSPATANDAAQTQEQPAVPSTDQSSDDNGGGRRRIVTE